MENVTFKTLVSMDFNKHVEVSNGFKYLSWSYAWGEIKKIDQEANYEILENEEGLPFFESKLGIFVKTQVTFKNVTHKMILPVLDGRNKAMKTEAYKYKAGKSSFEYECKAADSFDINKAILRCLVKNIAMHGVGLYIYQGEDIPENLEEIKVPTPSPTPTKKTSNSESEIKLNFDLKLVEQALSAISSKTNIEKEILNLISEKNLTEAEILKLNELKDYYIKELLEKEEAKRNKSGWINISTQKATSNQALKKNVKDSFELVAKSADTKNDKEIALFDKASKYIDTYQDLNFDVEWFSNLYKEYQANIKAF